jgi:drug/metabolite transporter (DMT)-like permease
MRGSYRYIIKRQNELSRRKQFWHLKWRNSYDILFWAMSLLCVACLCTAALALQLYGEPDNFKTLLTVAWFAIVAGSFSLLVALYCWFRSYQHKH